MKNHNNFPNIIPIQQPNHSYINTTEIVSYNHDVFLDKPIEEATEYRDLISLLVNANEGDVINLFINSPGGLLDTSLAIIESIKVSKAYVVGIINGACHSAASILVMYCSEVIVLDNAYMMIHTASFGSSGMTNNVKNHTDFTVRQVESLLDNTYSGFLTKKELENIKQGLELWLDAEDIRGRLVDRQSYLKKQYKKMQHPKIVN